MSTILPLLAPTRFDQFYSTAASVISTLYVALAVELGLLRVTRRPVRLPAEGRSEVVVGALILGGLFVAGLAGLFAALYGLSMGAGCVSENVAMFGCLMMLILVGVVSVGVFAEIVAQALPERIRALRRPVSVTVGVVMVVVGLVGLFTWPSVPGC